MKRNYHTIEKQGKVNAQKLGKFLSQSGQLLLPIVDLIEHCRMACDELIDVAEMSHHPGRAGVIGAAGGRPTPAGQAADR